MWEGKEVLCSREAWKSLGIHPTRFTSVCGPCADATLTFVFLGQILPSGLQTRVAICPWLLYADISEAPQTPFPTKTVPSVSAYDSTNPWELWAVLETFSLLPFISTSPDYSWASTVSHICASPWPATGPSHMAALPACPQACPDLLPSPIAHPSVHPEFPSRNSHQMMSLPPPLLTSSRCVVLRTQKKIDLLSPVTSPYPPVWPHLLVLHPIWTHTFRPLSDPRWSPFTLLGLVTHIFWSISRLPCSLNSCVQNIFLMLILLSASGITC